MTRILFDPRTDTAAGSRTLGATVTARATHAREDGAVVVYPSTIGWRFTADQRPAMQLEAPASGWAWIFEVTPDEGRAVRRVVRWGNVAEVAWAALVDVDPATLDPQNPSALAGWDAVLAEVDAARVAALAQIAAAGAGLTYQQTTPSAQWSIPHSFPRRPNVALYTPAGVEMLAEIIASSSLVLVTFANPTAGSAVLT